MKYYVIETHYHGDFIEEFDSKEEVQEHIDFLITPPKTDIDRIIKGEEIDLSEFGL